MAIHTDNAAEVGMHVFERAGLGKAPFRCIGIDEKFITHPDGTTQASGSCAYCSTGIRYVYIVIGRDRKPFGVGCDCVERTDDAGLIRSYKNLPEVRALNRARAKAKDDAIIAEWNALFSAPETISKLSAIMVPGRPWVPGDEVTLFDDFKRIWGMCGAAGHKRTLKALKNRLAAS
jgi:hypothetical protein